MAVENNILIMQFPEPSKAFQALSEMKEQPGVAGAAVMERTPAGELRVADGYTPETGNGIVVGGLVGGLIGILAGPLGVLLGWTTGALAGAVYEAAEADDDEDGFTVLSRSVEPGANALIVEMSETSHAIADDVTARLGGTIVRVPSAEVAAEVDAAREAARKAASEARKARRAQRRAEFKAKLSGLGRHPQHT
jgi:uncharacterized membrane protein